MRRIDTYDGEQISTLVETLTDPDGKYYCDFCSMGIACSKEVPLGYCNRHIKDFLCGNVCDIDTEIPQLEAGDVIHTRINGEIVTYIVYCLDPIKPDTYIVYNYTKTIGHDLDMKMYKIKEDPNVYKITRLDEDLMYKRVWADSQSAMLDKAIENDFNEMLKKDIELKNSSNEDPKFEDLLHLFAKHVEESGSPEDTPLVLPRKYSKAILRYLRLYILDKAIKG